MRQQDAAACPFVGDMKHAGQLATCCSHKHHSFNRHAILQYNAIPFYYVGGKATARSVACGGIVSNENEEPGTAQTQRDAVVVPLPDQVIGSLASWKELLRDEELRCAEFGIGAAILSIGVPDTDDARAVQVICSALHPTDRVCILRSGEYGVLTIPVDGARAAEDRANEVYSVLEKAKFNASMGWALRHDGHGLFHAAAQADAAMLRSGPNRIDLT
jgi:hypothetical protein